MFRFGFKIKFPNLYQKCFYAGKVLPTGPLTISWKIAKGADALHTSAHSWRRSEIQVFDELGGQRRFLLRELPATAICDPMLLDGLRFLISEEELNGLRFLNMSMSDEEPYE